eukprot:1220962-Pyramimonas_sp.AAC.1
MPWDGPPPRATDENQLTRGERNRNIIGEGRRGEREKEEKLGEEFHCPATEVLATRRLRRSRLLRSCRRSLLRLGVGRGG